MAEKQERNEMKKPKAVDESQPQAMSCSPYLRTPICKGAKRNTEDMNSMPKKALKTKAVAESKSKEEKQQKALVAEEIWREHVSLPFFQNYVRGTRCQKIIF